jgi:hypothetical protein
LRRPHTQSVGIRWRRSLNFYERHLSVLRGLETAGLLSGFMVQSDGVNARLGDSAHEIQVNPTGATALSHAPDGNEDRLRAGLGIVVDTLKPESVIGMSMMGQYLVALAGEYDKARTVSFQNLATLRGTRVKDWAFLLDLEGDRPELEGQVEAGIVSRDEIADRVSRETGRISGPAMGQPDGSREKYPEVALFADFSWIQLGGVGEEALMDSLQAFWTSRLAASSELVDRLIEGADIEEKGGGKA